MASCTISRIHGATFSPFWTGSPMFSYVMSSPKSRNLCATSTISRMA